MIEDGEYEAAADEEADDESTLLEAEAADGDGAADARALEADNDGSIERLLKSYGLTREQYLATGRGGGGRRRRGRRRR